MRLRRIRVKDFAGIMRADVTLGPGLNVLHGPNDLGKSTLADAIRAALLLPHGSSHAEQYVSWSGGQRPEVELTFETEAQRIWRVTKQFGRGAGASLLQESRDGVDFSDVEKGRKVDGRIREILRWGIPEPGGSGSPKGMPESFLATVLLSTQSDVAAVLQQSLDEDPSGSGKERIAAALQAVAQDPLFLSLLRRTQARRDEAYTEKGAKKSSKESPFRKAADLVRHLRDEKERWRQAVDDSESVERELRKLATMRAQAEERASTCAESLAVVERLARETANLREADEQVTNAAQQVARIQNLDRDIREAQDAVQRLADAKSSAAEALKGAEATLRQTGAALEAAQRAHDGFSGATGSADTVQRQALELRIAAADRARAAAEHRLQMAAAAAKKVDEACRVEAEHRRLADERASADVALSDAVATEERARADLQRIEFLECALALRGARAQRDAANAAADRERSMHARANALSGERHALQARRSALGLPPADAVSSMRRLERELAAARGALDVGLVVTIAPRRPLDARIRRDEAAAESVRVQDSIDLEGNAEIDVEIVDVAALRIRGGRREAQERARALEQRWTAEAIPLLTVAGAATLAELDLRIAEGETLDRELLTKQAELASLEEQLATSAGAEEAERQATERLRTCQAALGTTPLEPLLQEITALGPDPAAALRKRKETARKAVEAAHAALLRARTTRDVADERLRSSKEALAGAQVAKDAAVAELPGDLAEEHAGAQRALDEANARRRDAQRELELLDERLAHERANAETALARALEAAAAARHAADGAHQAVTEAITAHSVQTGRLEELRRLRAAEELAAAEHALDAARRRRAALPVPPRGVEAADIAVATKAVEVARGELAAIEREMQRAHGALEQVGGGVAREKLREAIEACDQAERHEREVEVDCEAWRLLLEQMKHADAEQASNLGQVLGPAVAGGFEALTRKRYQGVQLDASLGTTGVVLRGEIRPSTRLSVGTREQLSTLYRLALAEYLESTVVLDDQLVQSDEVRMDWFRALLAEKGRAFQIIVFTCRAGDYLDASSFVVNGTSVHTDLDDGFVRAVDLNQVIERT